VGVETGGQEAGVSQSPDEVADVVYFSVKGLKGGAGLPFGLAGLAQGLVEVGDGFGQLAGADIFGDDAVTLAAFAVVIGFLVSFFPGHFFN
jgi:hypothetical protein